MPVRPAVDPAAIRPKRYWYVIAGALALVGLLVPLAVYVVHQLTAPKLTEVGVGVTSLTMKSTEPKWLYVSKPRQLVPPPCQLMGPGDVQLEPLTSFPSVDYDGATWYAVAKLKVTQDGSYTLACVGAPGGIRLAVGGAPSGPGILGGLLANVVVPVLLVLAALVLAGLTFLRRRSHRAGLLAAGGTPGGAWGPQGPVPPGHPMPQQPPAYDYPPAYDHPPAYQPPPGQQPPPTQPPSWGGPPPPPGR